MQIPIPVFKFVEWNTTFSDGLFLVYFATGLFLAILSDWLYKKLFSEAETYDRLLYDRLIMGYFIFAFWPLMLPFTVGNIKSRIDYLESRIRVLSGIIENRTEPSQKKKRRAR